MCLICVLALALLGALLGPAEAAAMLFSKSPVIRYETYGPQLSTDSGPDDTPITDPPNLHRRPVLSGYPATERPQSSLMPVNEKDDVIDTSNLRDMEIWKLLSGNSSILLLLSECYYLIHMSTKCEGINSFSIGVPVKVLRHHLLNTAQCIFQS